MFRQRRGFISLNASLMNVSSVIISSPYVSSIYGLPVAVSSEAVSSVYVYHQSVTTFFINLWFFYLCVINMCVYHYVFRLPHFHHSPRFICLQVSLNSKSSQRTSLMNNEREIKFHYHNKVSSRQCFRKKLNQANDFSLTTKFHWGNQFLNTKSHQDN